jgi:small subunit ribosomal protein S17
MANNTRTGIVTSSKMDKTIVVTVYRTVKHPLYKKIIKRKKRYIAHDEYNRSKEGDVVIIEATRPLSKRKRWRLVKIVQSAKELGKEEVKDDSNAIDSQGS